MITLKEVLQHGALVMLKQGPPDNLADAKQYLKQGTEVEQKNAQAILDAITLLEVIIVATPEDGEAIMDHLTKFYERHKA